MEVELHVSMDYAIEDIPSVPGELVVPDEYKDKLKRDPGQELKRLQTLVEDKVISPETFEAAKKKLTSSGN